MTRSGGGEAPTCLSTERASIHPGTLTLSRDMAIQRTGGRGQGAAELREQRRSNHCDDRKQVSRGSCLFASTLYSRLGTQAILPVAATHSFVLIHTGQESIRVSFGNRTSSLKVYTQRPQVTRPVDNASKEAIAVKSLVSWARLYPCRKRQQGYVGQRTNHLRAR